MKVVRFDTRSQLIRVSGSVWGPRERRNVRFAVDTGAEITLIVPEVLDDIGYSPRHGEAITKIRSAVAEEPGYLIRVQRLRALGHELSDLQVHAHDLPDGFGLDGLIGLNFLRHFNYEIRSTEGKIRVERVHE